MTLKKVRIIYNEDSLVEHPSDARYDDVGKTAEEVGRALSEEGFTVSVTPLKDDAAASAGGSMTASVDDFIRRLKGREDGIVFNLCEAAFGNSCFEMHVAAMLELCGIRFTGSGPLTLGLALDKGLSKDILNSRDIMTPEYCVLNEPPTKLKRGLKFPLIVKPLREDASVGIDSGAVVSTMKEFKKRVEFVINKFLQPAIVEEYIDGREFNVAVLGNGKTMRALPPAELLFVDFPKDVPKICSYEAKWDITSPLYKKTVPECPADVPPSLAEELKNTALKAYEMMGCRDYARVDLRLGEDGNLKVLEVNPNPDISSNAGLARAANAAGLTYSKLIAGIVAAASERYTREDLRKAASL